MIVLKYPIIIITVFFALGILAGYQFNLPPSLLYLLCVISFGLLIAAFWHAKKIVLQKSYFAISAFLFSFILGMLTQTLHYEPCHKLHYSHFLTEETPIIKGTISERLRPNDYQEKYYFDVVSVNQQPVTGKILLTVPKHKQSKLLEPGDTFIIADNPQFISKALNPYQFDYASYMQKQGVFHQLRLEDNFVKTGVIKNFDYYIGQLRGKLINSFAIHNYNLQVQQTLNALLLGQRQDMNAETAGNYKNAGVLHILAISGLHFAVLFYILTLLFKPLSRNGKLLQLIAVLSILWGFAFITGLSASVVRSVVMFSFICAGQYFNRNANIYNSLAVSMLVLLLAKPAFLFDAGFQLSYLAIFAIVSLEPFYRNIKRSKYKALNYISDTLLISLAAQIGVLPLSLYYFNQFPLLFLLANVVVIPLSNIVLILGLLIMILNFAWVDGAIFAGKLLGALVELMNGFIARIASFNSLVLKNIPFTLLLTITLYTLIVLAVVWLYKKSFVRTSAVLCSVFVFQCVLAITIWNSKNDNELIVFHNWNNTLIATKDDNGIIIRSIDSLAKESFNIVSYNKANFNQPLIVYPLQDLLYFKNNRILVLDKEAFYSTNVKPDILILTNSPKVNLERLLHQLKPKQVVADATNYKKHISSWKATCQNEKILFHATAEKGFYRIE